MDLKRLSSRSLALLRKLDEAENPVKIDFTIQKQLRIVELSLPKHSTMDRPFSMQISIAKPNTGY